MPRLARNTPHATRRLNVNCKILPELRDALLDAAEANGRTLAAEVEARLAASLADQDQRAMMREVVAEALAEHGNPKTVLHWRDQFDTAFQAALRRA